MDFLQEIKIAELIESDLKALQPLQPKDWNDISVVFRTHLNQPYFFPIKFLLDHEIIGIGELIMNDKSAWLGNIIVRNDFRKRGIGKMITKILMDLAIAKGADLQLLLATPMGKGLYENLGFEEVGRYVFFRKENFQTGSYHHKNIRKAEEKDFSKILELDRMGSGENRKSVLLNQFGDCWIFENKKYITGFFMTNLGDGLIISNDFNSGIALFKFREETGKNFVVVPEENKSVVQFLESEGYQLFREAIFMKIGKMKTWEPGMIFSRVGGYLG